MDSWKNDPDGDPHFILVFQKKIGFWLVIVLPKNSIGDYKIAFVAVCSVCPSIINDNCTVLNSVG